MSWRKCFHCDIVFDLHTHEGWYAFRSHIQVEEVITAIAEMMPRRAAEGDDDG